MMSYPEYLRTMTRYQRNECRFLHGEILRKLDECQPYQRSYRVRFPDPCRPADVVTITLHRPLHRYSGWQRHHELWAEAKALPFFHLETA